MMWYNIITTEGETQETPKTKGIKKMKDYELAIEKLNGNRWTKNGMDRVYISVIYLDNIYYDLSDEMKKIGGRLPVNRYERLNGKIWIDVETDEINTKGIDYSSDIISLVKDLLNA